MREQWTRKSWVSSQANQQMAPTCENTKFIQALGLRVLRAAGTNCQNSRRQITSFAIGVLILVPLWITSVLHSPTTWSWWCIFSRNCGHPAWKSRRALLTNSTTFCHTHQGKLLYDWSEAPLAAETEKPFLCHRWLNLLEKEQFENDSLSKGYLIVLWSDQNNSVRLDILTSGVSGSFLFPAVGVETWNVWFIKSFILCLSFSVSLPSAKASSAVSFLTTCSESTFPMRPPSSSLQMANQTHVALQRTTVFHPPKRRFL